MPAGILSDRFIAELQSFFDVGESLAGQSHEHVESAQGGSLVLGPRVETEGTVAGVLADMSRVGELGVSIESEVR